MQCRSLKATLYFPEFSVDFLKSLIKINFMVFSDFFELTFFENMYVRIEFEVRSSTLLILTLRLFRFEYFKKLVSHFDFERILFAENESFRSHFGQN